MHPLATLWLENKMAETKEIDLRTLAHLTGPFDLIGYELTTQESKWRAGETYISGLHLTVANKTGATFSVQIPARSIDYSRIYALLLENPGLKRMNFTWDEKKERVVVSGAL